MKKRWLPGLILLLTMVSCSDEGTVKVDIDSVGRKFDTTAERMYDTAKRKLEDLTEKIENKVKSKDTTDHK